MDQEQAIANRLQAAVERLMERAQVELGVSREAAGAGMLQAAVAHALKDMAPMAVAELLRDIADQCEHRTEAGDDARPVN